MLVCVHNIHCIIYCIHSKKFSWHKIFADGSKNENPQIKFSQMLAYHAKREHNYAYFADFIFADVRPTVKSAKICPTKIFHYAVFNFCVFTFMYTLVSVYASVRG